MVWGLQPAFVTGDTWYASIDNFKRVRHHSLSWIEAVERNRLVSVEKGTYVQIQQLDIPESGLVCYLKEFDTVKVFRTVFKNEYRYYTLYASSLEQLKKLTIKISKSFMITIFIMNNFTGQPNKFVILNVFK